MGLLVVAFLAMLFKDVLSALYVRYLGAKRWWRAGSADGLTDICALFSVGITGAAIHSRGFCLWSAAAAFLIFVASVLGTRLGGCFEGVLDG